MKLILVSILLTITTLCAKSQTSSSSDTICLKRETYKEVLKLAVDAECSQAELAAAKIELNLSRDKIKRKNRVILGGAVVVAIIETVRIMIK